MFGHKTRRPECAMILTSTARGSMDWAQTGHEGCGRRRTALLAREKVRPDPFRTCMVRRRRTWVGSERGRPRRLPIDMPEAGFGDASCDFQQPGKTRSFNTASEGGSRRQSQVSWRAESPGRHAA